MIVSNNTSSDIKIQIDGIVYEVKANDELSGIKSEHASHWKGVHSFLTFREEGVTEEPAMEAVTEPKTEEDTTDDAVGDEKDKEAEEEKKSSSKDKKSK